MKKAIVVATISLLVAGAMPRAEARARILALGSVTMDVPPTAVVAGWSLAPTGVNTRSGGTVQVTASLAYTLTVIADKARLSEYNTGTSAYVAGGKTIAAALSLTATKTSGTGTGLTTSVGTSSSTLATGLGVGTDVFSIGLSQTTTIADGALASGRTYRIVVTYSANAAL